MNRIYLANPVNPAILSTCDVTIRVLYFSKYRCLSIVSGYLSGHSYG